MNNYLLSINKQFEYYKQLGTKTINQLNKEELHLQHSTTSNSIAVLVKHLSGNMLSRWTNFTTEDGEKPWRNRDDEFIDSYTSKVQLTEAWETGWDCVFSALSSLTETDLERIIYIRNQGHTITEAINRQLMHYAYHIGQIVFIGKLIKGTEWETLSIPKGDSKNYNKEHFNTSKSRAHFTDEL
jgi:predicted secreted protein